MHNVRPALPTVLTALLLLALHPGANAQVSHPQAALLRPSTEARVVGPALVIDTFQHDTPFYKQSSAGSVEVDLHEVLLGTRSLRVSTEGDRRQVNLRATDLEPLDALDDPLDHGDDRRVLERPVEEGLDPGQPEAGGELGEHHGDGQDAEKGEVPEAPAGRELETRELEMAERLVEMLEGPFEPEEWEDTWRNRVMELIAAKAEGKTVELREYRERRDEGASLEEALAASLKAAGARKSA